MILDSELGERVASGLRTAAWVMADELNGGLQMTASSLATLQLLAVDIGLLTRAGAAVRRNTAD